MMMHEPRKHLFLRTSIKKNNNKKKWRLDDFMICNSNVEKKGGQPNCKNFMTIWWCVWSTPGEKASCFRICRRVHPAKVNDNETISHKSLFVTTLLTCLHLKGSNAYHLLNISLAIKTSLWYEGLPSYVGQLIHGKWMAPRILKSFYLVLDGSGMY